MPWPPIARTGAALWRSLPRAQLWCHALVILESDCSSCVAVLAEHGINRSIHASLVEDSKNIMRMLGNVHLVNINRAKYNCA